MHLALIDIRIFFYWYDSVKYYLYSRTALWLSSSLQTWAASDGAFTQIDGGYDGDPLRFLRDGPGAQLGERGIIGFC